MTALHKCQGTSGLKSGIGVDLIALAFLLHSQPRLEIHLSSYILFYQQGKSSYASQIHLILSFYQNSSHSLSISGI